MFYSFLDRLKNIRPEHLSILEVRRPDLLNLFLYNYVSFGLGKIDHYYFEFFGDVFSLMCFVFHVHLHRIWCYCVIWCFYFISLSWNLGVVIHWIILNFGLEDSKDKKKTTPIAFRIDKKENHLWTKVIVWIN